MNNKSIRRIVILAAQASLLMVGAQAAPVSDPVLSINGLSSSQQTVSVTITDTTGGATISYTTDGSLPTVSGNRIASGAAILVPPNDPLSVMAFAGTSGTATSDLVTGQFRVNAIVSAGSAHTLAIRNDGTVWAWGDNSAGELGNGTNASSSSPVQVLISGSQPLTGAVAVAADNDESFAVDNQGNVWAWGLNNNGQLGLGSSTNVSYATQIATIRGVVGIASCQAHTLVVANDGTVWGWGNDSSGQIGNGVMTSWVTGPTKVMGPGESGVLEGIVAVAAGAGHSLALDQNGNLWAWGSNSAGQLGNGDTTLTSQAAPVQVGAGFTGAVAVAAGALNSFALLSNGSTWAWGDNAIGELGNGNPLSVLPYSVNPMQVSATNSIVAISNQTAIESNGTVLGWGDNTGDRLAADFSGSYATMPLIVSLATSSPISLSISSGGTQTLNEGVFSTTPLTISATISGSPATNTLIDFISEGTGLLSSGSNGADLSGIVQVTTNSSGKASAYYMSPVSGSGSALVEAASLNSDLSTPFDITLIGIPVPAIRAWTVGLTLLLLLWTGVRFLPNKSVSS